MLPPPAAPLPIWPEPTDHLRSEGTRWLAHDQDLVPIVESELKVGSVDDVGSRSDCEARGRHGSSYLSDVQRVGTRQNQYRAPCEYQEAQELDREVEWYSQVAPNIAPSLPPETSQQWRSRLEARCYSRSSR